MSDYKALYRKWRPFDFDDVCGQKSITDILKFQVANRKISHAYLFCGSRGTGKTSCAKILAKAVNCEASVDGNPCNKCEACRSIDQGIATDVIEMDAASNNGVDNVRTLKDEITFTPAVLKYRVYIIDEVHMMSGAAFNALLKTLEEPPSYVVFILATTEFNKLPTTIVSRCQRFDFKRMAIDVIVDRLMHISKEEGIDLGSDGARLIAREARGGMRDAVSLLELCAGSHRHIDAALVSEATGTGDRAAAYRIIEAISKQNYDSVYSIIRDVVMSSADLSVFWQDIIDSYRDIMVVKTTDKAKSYLDLTDMEFETLKRISESFSMSALSYHASVLESAMSDMQRAVNSKRSIAEIALTKMCDPRLSASVESLALRIEELEKQVAMMKLGVVPQPKTAASEAESVASFKEAAKTVSENKPFEVQSSLLSEEYTSWASVIEKIGEIKRSLASQLNSSEAKRSANTFTVTLNPFFAQRISSNPSDLAILKGIIAEREGISREDVELKLIPRARAEESSPIDEIEKMIK